MKKSIAACMTASLLMLPTAAHATGAGMEWLGYVAVVFIVCGLAVLVVVLFLLKWLRELAALPAKKKNPAPEPAGKKKSLLVTLGVVAAAPMLAAMLLFSLIPSNGVPISSPLNPVLDVVRDAVWLVVAAIILRPWAARRKAAYDAMPSRAKTKLKNRAIIMVAVLLGTLVSSLVFFTFAPP